MRVFFHQGEKWRKPPLIEPENDLISLSFNNWDDYGIKTTFNAAIYINKRPVLGFSLKLLIEENKNSPALLNRLRETGWDGFLPIPSLNYISIPSEIEIYDVLISTIGIERTQNLLRTIRDAGYLTNIDKDENAIRLIKNADFNTSLLREAGARKAFDDGWSKFSSSQNSKIKDFIFNTNITVENTNSISFKFNSDILPYDINILIGPNGIGKSSTLKSLVNYWLGVNEGSKPELEKSKHVPFDHYPNISKLILISYSPFEEFTIDLSNTTLQNKDIYKYFGFRKAITTGQHEQKIDISRNLPAHDAVMSIIKALDDDMAFDFIRNWQSKFTTIFSVLEPNIGFDSICLALIPSFDNSTISSSFLISSSNKIYLKINRESYIEIKKAGFNILDIVTPDSGVTFFKDKNMVKLSSGQRLFTYIVINVVGQIKKDSLIVIDEPELFLHPTLEIEFISLLKNVLTNFTSKAIMATHSLLIAREVPANCTHVYRKHGEYIDIDHPPFETFGGDIQRISSYVFCDNITIKPFDRWIKNKVNEFNSVEQLIKSLGKEVNEEMMIKIYNSGKK